MVLQANRLHLLSDEHFSVDSTVIEAADSLKSLRPKVSRRNRSGLTVGALESLGRFPP